MTIQNSRGHPLRNQKSKVDGLFLWPSFFIWLVVSPSDQHSINIFHKIMILGMFDILGFDK